MSRAEIDTINTEDEVEPTPPLTTIGIQEDHRRRIKFTHSSESGFHCSIWLVFLSCIVLSVSTSWRDGIPVIVLMFDVWSFVLWCVGYSTWAMNLQTFLVVYAIIAVFGVYWASKEVPLYLLVCSAIVLRWVSLSELNRDKVNNWVTRTEQFMTPRRTVLGTVFGVLSWPLRLFKSLFIRR